MKSTPPPRLPARLALLGMSLAVVALGALAVWAAIVSQNGAHGLSQAGMQASGHLRAIQALSILDTSTDALELRIEPRELAKLRRSQRVLDQALERMDHGGSAETTRIANLAKPIVVRLNPAIEAFLERPAGQNSAGTSKSEERMDAIMGELEVHLNDLSSDPSRLLTAKLDAVTDSERTVRAAAVVLIPLGLGGVAACGWLLSVYRRRSEATMLAALDTTAQEARTDQLTGLPNRRALLEELEFRSDDGQSFSLALGDLNGFKRYNDTFGHPAGDALLSRLGSKLAIACEGRGMPARLGGDEFCILFFEVTSAADADALMRGALNEKGEGFHITAESGVAAVPEDAVGPEAALRLADARMYAAKDGTRPSADQGVSEAMTRMLDERHPGLGQHVEKVAALSASCAEALGLSAGDVAHVRRAAELHDVGKVAIPAAILSKEGPLSNEEWSYMQRHSIIGERIITGVPSMERVAKMVRSSHERWDGQGYPDGLAGEAIPIGARIICLTDAFCAMTEERPYAKARSAEFALKEISACAGTQFDPHVVAAFLAAQDPDADVLAPAATLPA